MSVPVSPVSDPAKIPTPSAAPRSASDSVEVQSQLELVKMAFGELQPATLASGAVAIAFAIALSLEITSAFIWPWLVAMLLASGYRLWLANAFRLAAPTPDKIASWARRYTTATL